MPGSSILSGSLFLESIRISFEEVVLTKSNINHGSKKGITLNNESLLESVKIIETTIREFDARIINRIDEIITNEIKNIRQSTSDVFLINKAFNIHFNWKIFIGKRILDGHETFSEKEINDINENCRLIKEHIGE